MLNLRFSSTVCTMKIINGAELEVVISDLAFGGQGVAKVQIEETPFTIFVDGGLPEQELLVRISKKKRRCPSNCPSRRQQPPTRTKQPPRRPSTRPREEQR
jgi:tRNA/tmRNA/rRNA uracil-C5-methylase (TrmA/RlmC/RlmD family)